jgi:hypothetical protein
LLTLVREDGPRGNGDESRRRRNMATDETHAWKYCITCGGRYGDNIASAEEHDEKCPFKDDAIGWCGDCGAELTDFGTCLNDRNEED